MAVTVSGPLWEGLAKPANVPVTVIHPPGNWHRFTAQRFQDTQPEVLQGACSLESTFITEPSSHEKMFPAANRQRPQLLPLPHRGKTLCQAPSCSPNATTCTFTKHVNSLVTEHEFANRSSLALGKMLSAFGEGLTPHHRQQDS